MATIGVGRLPALHRPRITLSLKPTVPRGSLRSDLLSAVATKRVTEALHHDGLRIDIGATTLNVRGNAPRLAQQLQAVYPHFPFEVDGEWADIHGRVDRATGVRRWLRPQVVMSSDGRVLFEPFPADTALPLLEWGCNWLIGQQLNHLLLFHAGVLERDGLALVLPAMPGSGKSTLSAALSRRGWRLLSDEFGAFDPVEGHFMAMLKPVALKNESINVIRSFAPEAHIGPEFPRTRKGTVAHLAADADAVQRRHEPALPGAIVLPRWQNGSPTVWSQLKPHSAFSALAFNAFNYQVLGEQGFESVVGIARQCRAWELVYSDLDEAVGTIERNWLAEVVPDRRPTC